MYHWGGERLNPSLKQALGFSQEGAGSRGGLAPWVAKHLGGSPGSGLTPDGGSPGVSKPNEAKLWVFKAWVCKSQERKPGEGKVPEAASTGD
jgi:hypothetical protein